jgi:predicted ATPase
VRTDLPSGTVTFLFTDVEGSTKLLHEVGAEAYAEALAEHRRILRTAFGAHGGVEVDTQGDAFFYAFPTALGALEAARQGQQALSPGPLRVRVGVHTGTPHVTDEGYVGPDVHKGARLTAAGHGGQVLLSKETRAVVDIDVTDLGEHRLKDFDEPVWIYQLGGQRFPPLKTISNTNLPRPASSFVGREKERDRVVALLRDDARLVTLTGPGGSGKTRLSIEAAAELVPDYRNGVFWVGLATLRDPGLVTITIGQTLGAKEGLAEHIGEREILLLLDNFEQVVDAALELSSLLSVCPNLRVLVTSRESLRIEGEVAYPVPPLARTEAVELFCTRSGLAPADTIVELCDRLDDLPLAVELAAARTTVLSPPQILARLGQRLDLLKGGRDADPRQQTLRATIEWSHHLLGGKEKALFARLAVFAGCTIEAAEEVAGADLDTLQSLIDKSLLRHTDERFWMLETIREYASEQLKDSGEAEELRRRHTEYFLALAEEAEPSLSGEGAKGWLDRLEREHDNIRAALDCLQRLHDTQLVLRLAGALVDFWQTRGHLVEGRRRLEGALRADHSPTVLRAKALTGAAWMAIDAGDPATAKLWAEEARAIHRNFNNARGAADATLSLAFATEDEGDMGTANQLFDESERAFRELGDEEQQMWATRGLAWTSDQLGDRERARSLYEHNLRRSRALQDESTEAHSLGLLAMIAVDEGRFDEALSMLKHVHRLNRDPENFLQTAIYLCRSARAFAAVGRAETATRLVAWSEAVYEELGSSRRRFLAEMNEGTLTTVRAQLDEAEFAEAWEQGRVLTVEEAIALALDD